MRGFLKYNVFLKRILFSIVLIFSAPFICRAQDANLSAREFLHIALVASGCAPEKIERLEEKAISAAEEYILKSKSYETEWDVAENALLFLYQKFLNMYVSTQTLFDVAIENGKYNCVSSSVLFMYFMKECGIECVGNETPMHAFCSVVVDGKKVDVETTNPYGFNPGEKKQVSDKRYYVVPAKNYRNRVEIGDRRLLALIYTNRVTTLQKSRNVDGIFQLAEDAEELQLKSDVSVEFVYTTAMNVVAEYTMKKRYDDALNFARKFFETREHDKRIVQNVDAACAEVIRNFERKGDYEGAFDFLEENSDIMSAENYDEFYYLLVYNSLTVSAKSEAFEIASEKIEDKKDFLKTSHYNDLIQFCYIKETERISRKEGNYNAYIFALEAAEKFPEIKALKQNLSISKQNYAVDVHNKIVPLVNSGKIAEARAIVESALQEFGSERLLENDLARMR